MSGRSLVACSEGIDKAKKALKCRNLTQTAIAKEFAIASWSTVNKFFTGKPVDRAIFIEICFQLNLDWQEIAGTLEETDAEIEYEADANAAHVESIIEEAFTNATPVSVELEVIWANARRTRQALNPYILPTIRREKLLDKCLTQIQVGLDGKKRVLPILGAAGYGKSTILGTIYDELSRHCLETNTGWVALARCDDLVESAENFAKELGDKVSDRSLSIIEVAQQLSQTKGRGVLLLDTLDIVLTKPLVSVFRLMLSQLLECGTTVVFTCRDNDYATFFEPYHESFAGFREAIYNSTVPQFSESEVAEAAQCFASLKPEYPTEASQVAFATKILDLSADSVSLAEIVSNPLLLALLCELFAEAQVVPEDLTVSELYEIYWKWKIGKSRHAQQSPRIGKAKEKLCLFLAETLYQKSTERLRDFVYETSFDLGDETDFAAYTALRSDGILKELGNSRISFFHQTFLEYAIARWLNVTETGENTKSQIRRQLQINHPTEIPNYLWSIFRQLLTLVDLAEFYEMCQELDRQELLPFRAIAFAAISRLEPESSQVLLDLFEIASTSEYGFTEALLIAANSAPKRHGERAWVILIKVLGVVSQELMNKTIELTAEFLGRSQNEAEKFAQVVEALSGNSLMQQTLKNRYTFWGKFFKNFHRIIRQKNKSIDERILAVIQQEYSGFGSNVRAIAIDLFLTPGVSEIVQRNFLFEIIEIPPANNSFAEQDNAVELLSRLLPKLLASGNTVFGNSWLEALDTSLSTQWIGAIGTAVGKKAASDRGLVEEIIGALLDESFSPSSKAFNRSSNIALHEAIQFGGGNYIASALLNRSIENIPKNRLAPLAATVKNLAKYTPTQESSLNFDGESPEEVGFSAIDEATIVKLAEWFSPIIDDDPVGWARLMDVLGSRSPQVRKMLTDSLEPLLSSLKSKQVNQTLNKLDWIPPQLESYLQSNRQSKEARMALLKLYCQEAAAGSETAMTEIIRFCEDISQDVAKHASWKVLEFSRDRRVISVATLLPILSLSKRTRVRQNCLEAILEQVKAKRVSPDEITQVFQEIGHETDPEILQAAYQLGIAAIWHHPSGDRCLELPIADAVFELSRFTLKTAPRMTLDMLTNTVFFTLNQIVLLEDKRLIPGLTECTRLALLRMELRGKIDNLTVTGLLNHVGKFDPQFLEAIVQEDVLNSAKILPVVNLQALVLAICHNQGTMSPLLDQMLQNEKVPHETKSRILRERNL